jgi:hypothetical protein
LKINGSCNICISYENFTDSQILADDPKWLKYLNCKITCGIAGCSKKIQEKIEEQIKNILSKKGITNYSIQFCDGKRKLILKIKGSCNKCICISYENFTDSQILADDPKWLKCLNCKITCGITGCSKKS